MMALYSHYFMDGTWNKGRPLMDAPVGNGVVVAARDDDGTVLVGYRGRWLAYDRIKGNTSFRMLSGDTIRWVRDRVWSLSPEGRNHVAKVGDPLDLSGGAIHEGGDLAYDMELVKRIENELDAEDERGKNE
jgi:hypothetical protein